MNPQFFADFKAARAAAPFYASESYTPPGGNYARYRGPHDGKGLAAYAMTKAAQAATGPKQPRPAHWTPPRDHGAGAALRFVGDVNPNAEGWQRGRDFYGFYCNPWGESWRDGSGLAWGVVYQLAGRDGKARFVAGYQFGGIDGGPTLDFGTVYTIAFEESAQDGARHSGAMAAADSMAKRAAEEESEYQAAWGAGSQWAQRGEEIAAARAEARAILAERRAAGRDGAAYPALCNAIRGRVAELLAAIREAREERATLAEGDSESFYFWPGEERLRAAFCEGAGLDEMPGTAY